MKGGLEESWFSWIWTRTLRDVSARDNAKWAITYVSAAAILFSLIPLVIDTSGSESRPLTVGAGFIVGFVVLSSILRRMHTTRKCPELSMKSILERCRSDSVGIRSVIVPLVLTAIAGMSYVTLSWSTSFVDTAVSAALYEIWPMLWFIALQYIDKVRRGPHKRIVATWPTYGLLFMGFPAIALIVYSSGTVESPQSGLSLSFAGLLLAFIAPITGALVASNLMFVDRVMYGESVDGQDDWKIKRSSEFKTSQLEESVSIAGMVLTHAAIAPITQLMAICEVGFASAFTSAAFLGGIGAGCLGSVAGLMLRRAHLISNRREMISIQYLSPLLALLWLRWFVGIGIGGLDILVFGTVVIVSINMLLHSDPENRDEHTERRRESAEPTTTATPGTTSANSHSVPTGKIQPRYGLRTLVVSLLYFGMFVYFREEIFGSYEFGWKGSSYWAILALASTVFALLYAFRLSRVESLILIEDHRTLDLVRRVELLPREILGDDSSSSVRPILLSIRELNRASKLDEYREAYLSVHYFFQRLVDRISDGQLKVDRDVQREISGIRTELDALAHGRQNAREFAEQIALWLIGSLIVALALFVPSRSSEVALLLTDTFAIMLGSVVLFLLAHLADLGRSRADELLVEKDPERADQVDGLYVRFRDESDVSWRRIFATVIIVGIVATIVGLLAWDRLAAVSL